MSNGEVEDMIFEVSPLYSVYN